MLNESEDNLLLKFEDKDTMQDSVVAKKVTRNDPKRNLIYSQLLLLKIGLQTQIDIYNPIIACLYLDHLEDIPTQKLKNAFDKILRTSCFFPRIAEIRKICCPEETLSLDEKADLVAFELEQAAMKYQNRADEAVKNLKPAVFEVVAALTGLNDPTRAWGKFYADLGKLESPVDIRQWKKSLKVVSKKVCAEQQLPLSLLQLQN